MVGCARQAGVCISLASVHRCHACPCLLTQPLDTLQLHSSHLSKAASFESAWFKCSGRSKARWYFTTLRRCTLLPFTFNPAGVGRGGCGAARRWPSELVLTPDVLAALSGGAARHTCALRGRGDGRLLSSGGQVAPTGIWQLRRASMSSGFTNDKVVIGLLRTRLGLDVFKPHPL